MIISLNEAKAIDEDIEQEDLDAIEVEVRTITNNNFQNTHIRYKDVTFISDNVIGVKNKVVGLKTDDTIQINYSGYNDGIYTVVSVTDDTIVFKEGSFTEIDLNGAMLTKVEYPADIKRGVKQMLQYDKITRGKEGIASESIARMSITYRDGYPAGTLSFLARYEKMRW